MDATLLAVQGQPHPEERSEAERLEGWQRARCGLAPFETLAALAPQGEVNAKLAPMSVPLQWVRSAD